MTLIIFAHPKLVLEADHAPTHICIGSAVYLPYSFREERGEQVVYYTSAAPSATHPQPKTFNPDE